MFVYYYILFLFIFLPSIKSCPLKTVDSRSGCYCGIEIDGTNYIQCQPYSIDKIPEFTRSYIHDKLNLSFNFIQNLTQNSFNQLKVKKIYLEKNLINSIDKQTFNNNILNYLEELHIDLLNNHNLEFLCYGQWIKLRLLDLSGVNLNSYDHCLEKLTRLEKLIIKNSYINFFPSSLFKLTNLYDLSLINNQIEYIKFDLNYLISSSSIKIFNLTSNQIRTVPNEVFQYMPYLHTLDLSKNFIENLPSISERNVLTINLSANLINYVEINDQKKIIYDLSLNPICTLERTDDDNNKNFLIKQSTQLHCDCRLAYFLDKTLNNISKLIEMDHFFDNQTKCFTPANLKNRYLKDLTYEQLLLTCTNDLPIHCQELKQFKQIETYTKNFFSTPSPITTAIDSDLSSFRLTSFYTSYEQNNLIIHWDFDPNYTHNQISSIQFEIILEQVSASKPQIIRRTGFISPYLKKYIIHGILSNKNYYVCLHLTRSSYGTDRYCRETGAVLPLSSSVLSTTTTTTTSSPISNIILSKQAFVNMLITNRSIVFGFLFGTILTTGLLLTLAFICHLRSKRQRCRRTSSSLYRHSPTHAQQQQHYLYIDRNDDDGTYSNSIFSSTSSNKYNHFRKTRRRTCFPSIPREQSWYRRGLTPYPAVPPPPPCCFHHHHHHRHHTPDTTMSSSTTTRRITSLSSQYSNGMDKEPMTSTSIMSSTSSDEQTNNNSPAKHVYEELNDETTMLRRNHVNDVLL